ncbi:MAG TPA: thioredoxin family protein [Candidatus Thermoplasmatota archaeon]|nr:thioredoxin family protein [Candidatus Thermoplasmatota archaeon]
MSAPRDLADADLPAFLRENPNAVLDLWAEWCVPCLRIAPVLDELARDYAGRVAFGKVDTDRHPETLARYNVMGLPALLVFKDGRRVDHVSGFLPKPALRERLDRALGLRDAQRPRGHTP